jgi:hypothetical protein
MRHRERMYQLVGCIFDVRRDSTYQWDRIQWDAVRRWISEDEQTEDTARPRRDKE